MVAVALAVVQADRDAAAWFIESTPHRIGATTMQSRRDGNAGQLRKARGCVVLDRSMDSRTLD
ncbi:hypothetical protein DF047_28955 [Burkholderia cenocepacia]|nr:hypothetical protein DF047_28955 [Burkholderia cenocepacia]